MPKKIVRGISKLKPSDLNEKAQLHYDKMNGNAKFADCQQLLTKLFAARQELEIANTKKLSIDSLIQEANKDVDNKAAVVSNIIDQLASKIEGLDNYTDILAYEAGFTISKKATKLSEIDPPNNLTLKEGNGAGKIDVSVDVVKGAKSYIIEISDNINDANAWKQVKTSTKSANRLENLVSGMRIWVRVSAVGAAGQSSWSDVATRIVP